MDIVALLPPGAPGRTQPSGAGANAGDGAVPGGNSAIGNFASLLASVAATAAERDPQQLAVTPAGEQAREEESATGGLPTAVDGISTIDAIPGADVVLGAGTFPGEAPATNAPPALPIPLRIAGDHHATGQAPQKPEGELPIAPVAAGNGEPMALAAVPTPQPTVAGPPVAPAKSGTDGTAAKPLSPREITAGPPSREVPALAASGPAVTAAPEPATGAPTQQPPLPEPEPPRAMSGEATRAPAEISGTHHVTHQGSPNGNTPAQGPAGTPGQPGTATLMQASLSAPLSSPAWQQQLGQQLSSIALRGRHQVELHLNPAELGPLSVSLKVDDQGAQAQFLSAHGSVRAAVEQAIPQLREALAEQGIALGEASVGEQQRQFGGQPEAGNQDPAGTGPGGEELAGTAAATAPADTGAPIGRPGIDTYA